jgi:hypothetical protein
VGIVVIERHFDRPAGADQLRDDMMRAGPCMALHGAVELRHYLSRDRLRLVCVFHAPDAETMRMVSRTSGFSRPAALWAATVHSARHDRTRPGVGGGLVLVERSFPAPVDFAELQAREDASRACFDLRNVSFIRSLFSLDRRRMLCLYDAPDAETVREANRSAGLPFDVAWRAEEIVAEQPSPRLTDPFAG